VTLALIGGGIAFSLWKTRNDPPATEHDSANKPDSIKAA
jgi:hypothetical protein